MMILGGILTLCTDCTGGSYDDNPRYGYRPPTKPVGGGQEYI